MQLDTITMDPDVARAKVKEYRDANREKANAEDAAIARGYLHAAEGRPLIRLTEAMKAGGLDGNGLPRLAVAQADHPWCYLAATALSQDTVQMTMIAARDQRQARDRWYRPTAASSMAFDYPFGERRRSLSMWDGVRSQVPIVPPGLRPRVGGLHLYHVLWEVEEWAQEPRPPGDPALIRQVAGDLWAVFGVWDLTDLERAVLSGRT